MRLPLLISLSWLLLAERNVSAQLAPADDFFHSGAQAYITNNVAQAKEVVAMGRKLYPEDEKLKKLEELLNQKQQQQQQNQQQQKQQDKSEQQKSDDKKNQQSKPQNQEDQKPDEPKPEDKKDQSPDQKKDDLQPKPNPQKDSPDKPKDEAPKLGEGQPIKAGQMTPEEAKRLLDAQKGNEQVLQLKPPEKPRNSSRPIKDW